MAEQREAALELMRKESVARIIIEQERMQAQQDMECEELELQRRADAIRMQRSEGLAVAAGQVEAQLLSAEELARLRLHGPTGQSLREQQDALARAQLGGQMATQGHVVAVRPTARWGRPSSAGRCGPSKERDEAASGRRARTKSPRPGSSAIARGGRPEECDL